MAAEAIQMICMPYLALQSNPPKASPREEEKMFIHPNTTRKR